MKKTLLLALAAIATIFTSCSSDIINDNDDSNNGQGKGMTLIANVEQDDTRATLTTSDDTSGKWSFAYTDNDKVYVGNDQMENNYYTFTKSGEKFSSTEAKATNTDANWYAYYPSTTIDLTNQKGTEASAAELYALAGATTDPTTGAKGLNINMKAKAAVLRIVKVDNYGPCDIYLMTKEGKYVKGLKAKKNAAGFEVETSETRTSVFYKESSKDYKENKGNSGIYYVIVPAGVYLEVWNDGIKFKTTSKGLTAGRYYTLTSGPTYGTATATAKLADGTTKTMTINWKQLWIGGPRIATENVETEMSWIDAIKTGDDYVWGKNWCTPSQDDLDIVGDEGGTPKHIKVELSTDNGVKHFKYKGIQPGYTSPDNEMTIPFTKGQNEAGVYWTSSTDGKLNGSGQLTGTSLTITDWYGSGIINYFSNHSERHILYSVRPVLTIKTVLWGEQNIK